MEWGTIAGIIAVVILFIVDMSVFRNEKIEGNMIIVRTVGAAIALRLFGVSFALSVILGFVWGVVGTFVYSFIREELETKEEKEQITSPETQNARIFEMYDFVLAYKKINVKNSQTATISLKPCNSKADRYNLSCSCFFFNEDRINQLCEYAQQKNKVKFREHYNRLVSECNLEPKEEAAIFCDVDTFYEVLNGKGKKQKAIESEITKTDAFNYDCTINRNVFYIPAEDMPRFIAWFAVGCEEFGVSIDKSFFETFDSDLEEGKDFTIFLNFEQQSTEQTSTSDPEEDKQKDDSDITQDESSKLHVYEGEEPYIFVSYSHIDEETVLPAIEIMQRCGFRVWYDRGIKGGEVWSDNIAIHVRKCEVFVAFVSDNWAKSQHCLDEFARAKEFQRSSLLVYIEKAVCLPEGVDMQSSRYQRIYYNDPASKQIFAERICSADILSSCR